MQVAGIRRLGAPVEMIEVGEPRPLATDEVLLEVRAAGVASWDEFVRTGGWRLSRVPWNFGGGPLIIRLPSDPHSGLRR
jgi:D-arabinose 1-dehydrogenase-like Zn-dependent alcohol dehydrogenase